MKVFGRCRQHGRILLGQFTASRITVLAKLPRFRPIRAAWPCRLAVAFETEDKAVNIRGSTYKDKELWLKGHVFSGFCELIHQ